MKKLCFSAFIAFWASTVTLVSVNALAPGETTGAAGEPGAYTMEEVARHDGDDDCWIAVEGAVYDVTDYLPRHPTPPSVLRDWCGKEATRGMRTKEYGRDHSPAAWQLLEEYRIGDLEE